jgi:UDP-3-O-[3-hydroxymyristoyl] N-acetylglucosamine deacetylase
MNDHDYQKTLAKPAHCSGIGVHSGKKVNLTIKPAPINHGIQFKRIDLPNSPRVAAIFNRVVDASMATVIGYDGFIVSTIEHLMASFAGLSIDNALVEIDEYELPIMDGSAYPFTKCIIKAGIKKQLGSKFCFVVKQPIELQQNGRSVGVYPSSKFKITCSITYDHPLIKKQTYSIDMGPDNFEKEIARARTYGFMNDIEYLKRYGFAKGASLENSIVIDKDQLLNSDGLRFKDEFVRHKILDCLGDFSLLGLPIIGHIILNKSGHALNQTFIKEFYNRRDAWETQTMQPS